MKRDELVEKIRRLRWSVTTMSVTGANNLCDEIVSALAEAEQRERALVEEIAYLRQYGNKDCTAMADEALAAHRTDAGEGEE